MPDITKCRGEDCPLKDYCYRFTAEPDEYQDYLTESPIEGGKCHMFMRESAYKALEAVVKGAKK